MLIAWYSHHTLKIAPCLSIGGGIFVSQTHHLVVGIIEGVQLILPDP